MRSLDRNWWWWWPGKSCLLVWQIQRSKFMCALLLTAVLQARVICSFKSFFLSFLNWPLKKYRYTVYWCILHLSACFNSKLCKLQLCTRAPITIGSLIWEWKKIKTPWWWVICMHGIFLGFWFLMRKTLNSSWETRKIREIS